MAGSRILRQRGSVFLVNERTSLRLQACEDGGKIPGPVDHGAEVPVDIHLEFVARIWAKRSFFPGQASMEEHVVQHLSLTCSRLNEDPRFRLSSSCPTYSSRLFGSQADFRMEVQPMFGSGSIMVFFAANTQECRDSQRLFDQSLKVGKVSETGTGLFHGVPRRFGRIAEVHQRPGPHRRACPSPPPEEPPERAGAQATPLQFPTWPMYCGSRATSPRRLFPIPGMAPHSEPCLPGP